MKIVITQVGSALNVAGIPVFIFELSNALIRDGHEVYVISGREVPKTQTDLRKMFDIERLPRIVTLQRSQTETYSHKLDRGTMKEILLWLSRGHSLLKTIAPDMLIVNGAVLLYSSAFKVAVCHDLEFRRSYAQKLYNRVLYQTFDIVAATSTELAQVAPVELGLKCKKVMTIPTCIDTHKYTALAEERREHAILHVGTWVDKNLETTVRAFCKLVKTDPAIKLYIVGDLWKRPKNMLSKVREEFSKRIRCVGKISKMELRDLYSRVKVTSVPSVYRVPVLSPTVLESLASGTPVVGGSTAISRDLLVDGYNGFRVYPTDFKTVSERISILTTNKELWNRLSANARSVVKDFDASVVARRYIELYESFRKSHSKK